MEERPWVGHDVARGRGDVLPHGVPGTSPAARRPSERGSEDEPATAHGQDCVQGAEAQGREGGESPGTGGGGGGEGKVGGGCSGDRGPVGGGSGGSEFGDRQSQPLFRIVKVINTAEKTSLEKVKMANFVICILPQFLKIHYRCHHHRTAT